MENNLKRELLNNSSIDDNRKNRIIEKDITEKLNEVVLKQQVDKYLENECLIKVYYEDIVNIIYNRKIVNFYYGNVNINKPINFNFIEKTDSTTLFILEANSSLTLSYVEKVSLSLQNILKDTSMLFGFFINDNLEDKQIRVLIINTISE